MTKNYIHFNGDDKFEYDADFEDIESAVKQSPNRRIFGFIPFHIKVWNYAKSQKKQGRLNQYLLNVVGEEPVLYEPILQEKSRDQILKSLKNQGYFNARVESYSWLSNNEAEQHFYVYSGPAYTLKSISYSFEDTALIKEFKKGVHTSLVPGSRYDVKRLDMERNKLMKIMKNRGYFTFDKIHVVFDIDTNLPGEKFEVAVRLRNLRVAKELAGRDTIIEESHRKHYLAEVIIDESYQAGRSSSILDSILHCQKLYLFKSKPYVRPVRLSRNVFVAPGQQYSLDKTQYTYERISALNNFRFIDLHYEESEKDSAKALLDLKINLTKAPKQSMTFETVGTNQSGNLGISAGLNYTNRNLFRGAEQFAWKVYGGLEWQNTNSTVNTQSSEVIENIRFINAYEFGSHISLTIPDFFGRISTADLPWFKEPKTTVSITADRQKRPLYERTLLNTSYQYTLRLRPRDQLIIAPIDLSVIQLVKDSAFRAQLNATNNSLLINSYNDHIIPAGKISYAYNSQQLNKLKNFYYYKVNLEAAGNTLRALSGVFNLDYDEEQDSYEINGVSFAQYVKFDVDFAKYVNLTRESRMVYRVFAGLGIPLSNLNALPFERSFFAGGSNDMRAWRARALGPGSLSDTLTYGFDQVGEMQLEVNMEYRWEVIKQIEGALFMDIGNIWLLREDPQRPGAEFNLTRFYNDLAIAPGAGVRFNFNFFIFRLDAGLQLKDPSLPEGERWLFQPKNQTIANRRKANITRIRNDLDPIVAWGYDRYKTQMTFNLAIGYPF
ncbi:MAG: BamA/TamA family outer membrane protein [Bacteroidetes bacterium]|nr:BamA/TamA family outer membrane protein [Bacteroidota bacterium]